MPETMIKLFCWIFGDPKPFPVKISPDETVGDLKKAIVTVLRSLTVFKASMLIPSAFRRKKLVTKRRMDFNYQT